MTIVRVKHPDTGVVSRVQDTQYERHLQPLGFTLAEDEVPPAVVEDAAADIAVVEQDADAVEAAKPASKRPQKESQK